MDNLPSAALSATLGRSVSLLPCLGNQGKSALRSDVFWGCKDFERLIWDGSDYSKFDTRLFVDAVSGLARPTGLPVSATTF